LDLPWVPDANNVYDAGIYEDMLLYRRFPEEMFTGAPEQIEGLRHIMMQRPAP
jgi:hypothetical protein